MSILYILSVMFFMLFVSSIFIVYLIAKREIKYLRVAMIFTGGIGLVAIVLSAVSLFCNIY